MFYIVGVTETCKRLAVVGSEAQASEYIGTLPAAERGIYYIDGPMNGIVTLGEVTPDDLPADSNPEERNG